MQSPLRVSASKRRLGVRKCGVDLPRREQGAPSPSSGGGEPPPGITQFIPPVPLEAPPVLLAPPIDGLGLGNEFCEPPEAGVGFALKPPPLPPAGLLGTGL